MANIKSAKKRSKQNKKRRKKNSAQRSSIRTFIKKIHNAINLKKKESAEKLFKNLQKIIDRYSKKRIIHKNKAARHKSNLIKKIKSLK